MIRPRTAQIVPLLALLLATPAAAFDLPWTHRAEAAQDTPPRPVVSVIMDDIPSELRSVPGVVVAGTEVQLGFQTLGRLSARPVDVGDHVMEGALLAEQTPDDLQDNVRALVEGELLVARGLGHHLDQRMLEVRQRAKGARRERAFRDPRRVFVQAVQQGRGLVGRHGVELFKRQRHLMSLRWLGMGAFSSSAAQCRCGGRSTPSHATARSRGSV